MPVVTIIVLRIMKRKGFILIPKWRETVEIYFNTP